MPILRKWEFNGATCGIWKVTETAEELRYLLTDRSFTCDFFDYKSPSRQLEYLAVRVLLREILGRECRVFHYESGKPYLEDTSYRVSISHTKGYVAVILHPTDEVGIDIEFHSDRVKRVVGRFVSPAELSLIERNVDLMSGIADKHVMEVNMFLLFWSAKETMFKMLNSIEVDFMEHLSIDSVSFDVDATSDSFSSWVFSGFMHGHESKTSHNMRIGIEFCVYEDFVCTYGNLR